MLLLNRITTRAAEPQLGSPLHVPRPRLCTPQGMSTAPDTLTGLSAAIVPHREWARRKWFYADPLWYYHRPTADDEVVPDRQFFQLVDHELRDLCAAINAVGLHTTPSCQGHFYPESRFRNIWHMLTADAHAITSRGLPVKDSETDRPYRFAQLDYRLPWPSWDDFYAQAADHQGAGYLGILIPPDRPAMVERLAPLHGTTIAAADLAFGAPVCRTVCQHLLEIRVRPHHAAERTASWQAVTRHLAELLR